MKVAKMGAKSFEQSAGFLRIQDAENPLDNSAVHPESYHIVEKMAVDLNCEVADLLKDETFRNKIVSENYISEKVGLPTIQDIMTELSKPGRDPRETIKVFEFDPNIREMSDLRQGMVLPGIVTNITKFGAFVDMGIKENGLIHVSQMAQQYVSNPSEILKLNQHVSVKILDIDEGRKRISLTMKI
jgi:uncharacterized protein